MKVTLTYILPEEQDELNVALDGNKYKIVIDEVFDQLRRNIKYGRTPQFESIQVSDEQLYEVLENVRDMIAKTQADYGL